MPNAFKSLAEVIELYDFYENVDTSDGETIELYTCKVCGAVVRGITLERHTGWHEAAAS